MCRELRDMDHLREPQISKRFLKSGIGAAFAQETQMS